MPVFRYRAVDREGREVEGSTLGEEEAGVVASLRRRGLTLIACEPELPRQRRAPFTAADARDFFEELDTLLSSGLDLMQAVRTMEGAARRSGKRKFLASFRDHLNAGLPVSHAVAQAYAAVEQRVPELYLQLLRAGEAASELGIVLRRIVEHLDFRQRIRSETRSALAYPAVLTLVAIAAVLLLLLFVVPRFAALFSAEAIERLPPVSSALISLGNGFNEHPWVWLLSLAGLLTAGAALIRMYSTELAALAARVPFIGAPIADAQAGSYFTALGLMLQGGVGLNRALTMAPEVLGIPKYQRAGRRVSDLVREGETLAEALATTELVEPSDISMLSAAEKSGRLGEILARIGHTRASRFERDVALLLKLLEPAVVVVMGAIIGGIVVALMLAVLALNELPL